ncbi:MAG: amidohydrolase [bacterium]|nr:amidohydrolase [bacterium]
MRTLSHRCPESDAFLVVDGRVAALGHEIGTLRADRVIDAGGATILPGFVDAHTHLELTALALYTAVDCRPPAVTSIAEVQRRLREAAQRVPPGTWVKGQGTLFQDRQMAEGRYPNRHDLDLVSRHHPVVFRSSFHVAILNTKGLEVAGVDRHTPDPPGGLVERDADGEPTGLTKDMYHLLGVPEPSQAERRAAIERCVRENFLASGVTSLGEIGHSREGLETMRELSLALRVGVYVHVPAVAGFDEALEGLPETLPGGNPRFQGIKLFLDGGTTAMAAAFHDPYELDPSTNGRLAYDVDELTQMLGRATDAGVQLAMHAVGDRAQDTVIAAARRLPAERVRAARHRVEHAGNILCTFERRAQLRDAGLLPVPNPGFIYSFGDALETYLGAERTRSAYPFRSLIEEGAALAAGGDCSGTDARLCQPLFGIACAVTRRTLSGKRLDPGESIAVEQAIRMYTTWAAYAARAESDLGSIEAGKCADFVVLSEDPFTASPQSIAEISVQETWIDGRLVFSRAGGASSIPQAISREVGV